jgi:hypothetical protein
MTWPFAQVDSIPKMRDNKRGRMQRTQATKRGRVNEMATQAHDDPVRRHAAEA